MGQLAVKPRYLVMVTRNNNNKYYKQIPHGTTWTAEYGRVGASPQKREYSMSEWDKKYREKVNKGYTDQSNLVEDLIEEQKSGSSTYQELEDKAIAEIVERLQNMAKQAIARNYTVKSNAVTQAMIDEAQSVLESLLKIAQVDDFNETLLKLFSVIPRSMAKVSEYLASSSKDFAEIIQREQDLLDVMKGQIVQKKIEANTQENADDKNKQTILEATGLVFEKCDENDIKIIKKALEENACRFKQAWKVTNLKTQKRFDEFIKTENISETKYLWHGSRNENWWSILGTGLILRPTNAVITGKLYGYGCYFAPRAKKSLGYTSLRDAYWNNEISKFGFMALMDIAYGTPYHVTADNSKNYQEYTSFNYEKLQKKSPGANSLHAHIGANIGWSTLKNEEIIIYKEEQMTIKYLVELY